MSNTPAALCIGVCNVDVIAHVDDSFLERHNLDKGTTTVLSSDALLNLMGYLNRPFYLPGGCAANTACGLGLEDVDTTFCGMIGTDFYGDIFRNGFKSYNVAYHPVTDVKKHTSLCITLITPDKERSFVLATDMASWFLPENTLPDRDTSRPLIVYIETNMFRMTAGTDKPSMVHAVLDKYAADDTRIILNLVDTEVTGHHRDLITALMGDRLAFIVGNHEEMKALFNTDSIEAMEDAVLASGQSCVITMGDRGVTLIHQGKISRIPSVVHLKPADIVDTVGAGDQFSAGFIAGLVEGLDLEACCAQGMQHATEILRQPGARPLAA